MLLDRANNPQLAVLTEGRASLKRLKRLSRCAAVHQQARPDQRPTCATQSGWLSSAAAGAPNTQLRHSPIGSSAASSGRAMGHSAVNLACAAKCQRSRQAHLRRNAIQAI